MVINQPALYSIRVSITTALVAPLLYLVIVGSYDQSESGFAFVWALAAMGIGCACALPTSLGFYLAIKLLINSALTLNQSKLLLSVLSTLFCFIGLSLICGWNNFETIYYKLFVTYVVVSIICIWLYHLNLSAKPVEL
jgi:hypothetical protein